MNILKIKKRFGFISRLRATKALKKDLEKYPVIEHTYRFLKFFKKKMFFVGNIRNVKTVYLIPYNTKRGYFWFKQFYFPFNVIKEMRKNVVSRFVPALLLYFVLIVSLLFVQVFVFQLTALQLNTALYAIMMFVLPIAFVGIGSKNNVASGDAQLRFAFEMLNRDDPAFKNRVGFIFCDTTERQTVMLNIKKFFQSHHKNPLLIEIPFFSGEGELFVCGTKNESKFVTQFARKNKLSACMFPLLPEYYTYSKYMMLSYGKKDKQNDVFLKTTMRQPENLDQSQYDRLLSIVVSEQYD